MILQMLQLLYKAGSRLLLPALLLFGAAPATAQVQIGSAEVPTMNSPGRMSKEDFAAVKNTTTLFVLQSKDAGRVAEFEQAIGQVWKVTPFRVILPDDMDRYASEEYSFFSFGGYVMTNTNRGGTTVHITYDLWRPKYNKDGEWRGRKLYARISLSPDEKSMFQIMRKNWVWGNKKKAKSESTDILYTTANFDNWGPGIIKGYVKIVNDRLIAEQRQGPASRNTDEALLKNLMRDTLFVPHYVNDNFSPFSGKRHISEEADEADVSDVYPFPIRYVSSEELNQMLLHRTTPFYYLAFIRDSNQKFVNVFDGVTGRPVFSAFTPMSFNFKKKDLGRLAKEVKKS